MDHVDEFVLGALQSYDDKKVTDVARGKVDLSAVIAEGEEETEEKVMRRAWLPCVSSSRKPWNPGAEVRVSARQNDFARHLVSPEDSLSPQMEQMMRAMGQEVPDTKRFLEVNPEHVLIQKLSALAESVRMRRG